MLRVCKAVSNCNANGTMPRKQKVHPHLAPPHVLALPLSMSMSCPGDSRSHWIDYLHGFVRHAQPRLNFILSWQYMFIIYCYNCSWSCWYLCGACLGSELLYVRIRSSFVDVVLGALQVYTINQRDQCSLMYVLQSYLVEPASVRFESNSFQ